MNDLISVIVPAYNIAAALPSCLDSILDQSYKNIEIIVVNDGSVDNTGEIIDRYAAQNDRIVALNKENGGVTSARLSGLSMAKGQWIGFVDGDDMIDPDMYERLLKNAKDHDADISHCGYRMCFPGDRVDYYYNTGALVTQDRTTALNELLAGTRVEPGLWNKLFRRNLFEDLIMPNDIKINEDLLMNYYLFKAAHRSVYEDFCPYRYILRKGSAATASINKSKLCDPTKVMRMILDDADSGVYDTAFSRYLRVRISLATMSTKVYKNDAAKLEMVTDHRREARRELRHRRREIFSASIGSRIKIIALWCALSPRTYAFVHNTYSKAVGNDKKYDF